MILSKCSGRPNPNVQEIIEQDIRIICQHSDSLARLGLPPNYELLLHGPSGIGKTVLLKAAAHATTAQGTSCFWLSGAVLSSMDTGDAQDKMRQTFQSACILAPAVIFFDDLDFVATKSDVESSFDLTRMRLMHTFRTEMEAACNAAKKGLFILATTSRLNTIHASLRCRFQAVEVPPPDSEGRHEILQVHTRKMKLGDDVDLSRLAEETKLSTGSELEHLCKEAGIACLREDMAATVLYQRHFQSAEEIAERRGDLVELLVSHLHK